MNLISETTNSVPDVATTETNTTPAVPILQSIILKANSKDDTNSIQEPKKIVPLEEKVDGVSANFTREFPPYSITVLELKSK